MADSYLEEIASLRQKLLRQWGNARSQWKDQRAVRFERDNWGPLEASSSKTLRYTKNLAETLKKARQQCKNL